MFTWEFDTKKEKSASWYTIAVVVAIAIIIRGIITGLYVMSIVIFIASGVYILIENNSPDKMKIEINENGIMVGEIFYDYPKIESFAIIYKKNIPLFLRLKLTTRGFKILDIPVDNLSSPAQLRAYLLDYIAEDEKQELSNMDSLLNYLKL